MGGNSYDLTGKLSPFLDIHMVVKLVQFLKDSKQYDESELKQVEVNLLKNTMRLEEALAVATSDGDKTEIKEKIAQKEKRAAELTAACGPILELLKSEKVGQLETEGNFTAGYLKENEGITAEMIDALGKYGKFLYECGEYDDAHFLIYFYRLLVTDSQLSMTSMWGKVAAQIMSLNSVEDVQNCLNDLLLLQKSLDDRDERGMLSGAVQLEQLQSRSWLLHWSLFLFFKVIKGEEDNTELRNKSIDAMVELFMSPRYLTTIQANCSWLLRYLTVGIVVSKGNRRTIRQLVRAVSQENYTYSDPITKFVDALLNDYNFEEARNQLRECEALMKADFFLSTLADDFIEAARLLLFDTYCRIHIKVDLNTLPESNNMSKDESEKWVVDLIRNSRFDAKLDLEKGHILMEQKTSSNYQQTIDKTKDLAFKTYQLASNVLNTGREDTRFTPFSHSGPKK